MILIFDLDDTLYEEETFVRSGFRAVSAYGLERFGIDKVSSYDYMMNNYKVNGRGKVFDCWLEDIGFWSKTELEKCIRIYRNHAPEISLSGEAEEFLKSNSMKLPLYLVTDGHKIAQFNKTKALGLERFFKKMYITSRYGKENAKPSLYCFNKIRQAERVDWQDLIYVGDNPSKDFVNLNAVGSKTIRVLTGRHSHDLAKLGYDASETISSLKDLSLVLDRIGE